jgi:hypothetical protein
MQLRLGVSNGAPQQLSDLVVLVAFHFVQVEDLSASFGQFLHSAA